MMERLHVKMGRATMDGVTMFVLTPEAMLPENRNRLQVHVHGGCTCSTLARRRCPRRCSWRASGTSR